MYVSKHCYHPSFFDVMKFDLISDLHVCSDSQPFDWTDRATSPLCVVAGDVCCDPQHLRRALEHLGQQYHSVIYIDGNDEHRSDLTDLEQSYQRLAECVRDIPNVIWLHDNLVIIDDVAVIGTNAWYSFDADPRFSVAQGYDVVQNHLSVPAAACDNIMAHALMDARYLSASVSRLQTYVEVRSIMIVTHTVPHRDLVSDVGLVESARINTTINSYVSSALASDTERKINTWCFGHYHCAVDTEKNGVRYVSNPRGRFGTPWYREPYAPLCIDV